jgi:perosamine synthetase
MIVQIEPWINNEELTQLKRVIDSTFLTEHNLTAEFEDLTKSLTGAKYAISITNGTMALYAALISLGIGPGDEVIVPNLTFIATSNAVIMTGAKPVFCDVSINDFCADIDHFDSALTKKTKAIIPVHLYGQSANISKISEYATSKDLFLIEDAAQGVGVLHQNKHVGTFGDVGILSYYGNKTITCGEGGMVITNNEDLAKSIYRLKNHGRDTKGVFIHEHIGYNFSFTEMQAAIGIAQMHKLPKIMARKKFINDFYRANITSCGVTHIDINSFSSPVHWFTSIRTPNAEDLQKYLLKHDVMSRRFFYPLNMQPCYKAYGLSQNKFPNSLLAYESCLSLPSSYNIRDSDLDHISKLINKFYG